MNKSNTVEIRGVKVGGGNPIIIQSMTNTDSADAEATATQCIELADAGSELMRVTVNTNLTAPKVVKLRQILDEKGYEHLPIIGDFHFNGHTLLREFPEMALTLDKYRINPGNVGYGDKHDYNFEEIIKVAIENDKPVRIGVNGGSLDEDLVTERMNANAKLVKPKSDREVIVDAAVESALRSAARAEEIGIKPEKIILSVKLSDVQDVVNANVKLAERMEEKGLKYPLHLGLTEAGAGLQGVVSSSAALAILLNKGIGDTIRISLTPAKDQSRTQEVEACKQLLQALGRRNFSPKVTSCPGCGRTESEFFQTLVQQVNNCIIKRLPEWKSKHKGVENLKIAVMGCVVNGPGESKHADIAISLPGKTEKPNAPVYIKGAYTKSLSGENIPAQFIEIIEEYLKTS